MFKWLALVFQHMCVHSPVPAPTPAPTPVPALVPAPATATACAQVRLRGAMCLGARRRGVQRSCAAALAEEKLACVNGSTPLAGGKSCEVSLRWGG